MSLSTGLPAVGIRRSASSATPCCGAGPARGLEQSPLLGAKPAIGENPPIPRYDAIVIGAGPAGSTAAYRLAAAGASVLVVDRARFPRAKPCGGALTRRAVAELPFSPDPVVEVAVTGVRMRLRYRRQFERHSSEPLVLMTQRTVLDAFLMEQAVGAGAEFRDGVRATGLAVGDSGCQVRFGRSRERSSVLIGADGVNGISRRHADVAVDHGVSLEGNVERYDAGAGGNGRTLTIELGTVSGGYGWIFPKRGHLNVGVAGAAYEGPRLRAHLARLLAEHGLASDAAASVRGFRLPVRRPGGTPARGRLLLVGDAAGLVDPSTGDGIYEAFLSARLAAGAVLDFLSSGTSLALRYADDLDRALRPTHAVSWDAKLALERFPRLMFAVAASGWGWGEFERTIRGDGLAPVGSGMRRLLGLLGAAARRTGDPATPWSLGPRRLRPLLQGVD
jgi:geranylgeranyl reductase family protein